MDTALKKKVIVVGAGIAGISAAKEVLEETRPPAWKSPQSDFRCQNTGGVTHAEQGGAC